MICTHCQRTLPVTVKGKLQHLIKMHPEVWMRLVGPVIANPRAVGEQLGKYVREKFGGNRNS
jgi:hypothetical protein